MEALGEFHPKYRVLWLMGTHTGLRVSDLLCMRVGDLKASTKVREAKTGKYLRFKLSPALRATVRQYIRESGLAKTDYLFPSRSWRKDKPLSRTHVWHTMARIANLQGIDGLGTHSMRKTYASDLFRATGSLEAVQRALNHDHVSTTLRYLVGKGQRIAIVDAD